MKFLIVLTLILCSSTTYAAILIESPNGTLQNSSAITTMAQACSQTNPIHVTSALSASFSNISSVTIHSCSAPIHVHPGGSLGNTTTFRLSGPLTTDGDYQIFNGTGAIVLPGTYPVKPVWFGNCLTDLGIPLNKAISSIINVGGEIVLPSGSLTQLTAINLTAAALTGTFINSIKILGVPRNTNINAQLTGPAFDCTGAQFLEFRDFTVTGNASTRPTTAFLFARNNYSPGANNANSAGNNHMYNVTTSGYFSQAALYNYASEDFRAYDCTFGQYTLGKPAVVVTRTNILGLSSPYTTIASGSQSTTEIRFNGCSINNFAVSSTADSLYLEGVLGFGFENGFMVNLGRAYVYIDASVSSSTNLSFKNLMFDGSPSAALFGFYIHGVNGVAYMTVDNILDYGVKTFANGGLTLSTDSVTGDSLSSLVWKNYYATQAGATLVVENLDVSDITLQPGDSFIGNYGITRSKFSLASTKLTLTRTDLSNNNSFYFYDIPATGNGLNTTRNGATMPTTGSWVTGDRELYTGSSTTPANGWRRITTGSGNVLNTDWIAF